MEAVTVNGPVVLGLVRHLCLNRNPGEQLLDMTGGQFRRRFHAACNFFEFQDFNFKPYSLRRGGATYDFQQHGQLERTAVRGRWAQPSNARTYINEGLATLAHVKMNEQQKREVDFAFWEWLKIIDNYVPNNGEAR